MRYLVTGASGQLGSDLMAILPRGETAGADLQSAGPGGPDHRLDIADHEAVRRFLAEHRPEVVFNTAAFVAVDPCETDEGGRMAFRVNAIAVGNLARCCAATGAKLVHISTDYVFEGTKGAPYVESDKSRPISTYGLSKLAGEYAALAFDPATLVVRTCGLYGIRSFERGGGSFVEAILRRAEAGQPLKVVADQLVSPTYTADLAAGLVVLVEREATGVVHMVNSGGVSWYDFAKAALELAGLGHVPVVPTTTVEWKAPAKRPQDSRLASERLTGLGVAPLRGWGDGLAGYLRIRRRNVLGM